MILKTSAGDSVYHITLKKMEFKDVSSENANEEISNLTENKRKSVFWDHFFAATMLLGNTPYTIGKPISLYEEPCL